MNGPSISQGDVRALRESAAQLVTRLGLSGYDNASILKADAWVDTPEFRALWGQGSAALAYELGAYLGEAIIRRHGGKWSFGPSGPVVEIKRNGQHLVDPFGKVQKRAINGSVDQLLALVNLVEHVAARPTIDASAVQAAAFAALEESGGDGGGISGLRFLGYACLALIVFPLVLLVVLLFVTDPSYALIGGGCGVPLGLVALIVSLRSSGSRGPTKPTYAPGTLGFEAQLSLSPLRAKLAEKLETLGARPSEDALAEVAFYTAQVRELEAIVARRDASPGRGYIGFDVYTAPESSWARASGGPR